MVGNAIPAQAPGAEIIEIEKETETVLVLETEAETEKEVETAEIKNVPIQTEYDDIIAEVAEKYGVSAALIKAIIKTESNFNPNLTSRTNDYGLMQINACNVSWLQDELGVTDLFDPAQNIESGVYILSRFLKRYSLADALMAYNCGEGGAKRFRTYGDNLNFKLTADGYVFCEINRADTVNRRGADRRLLVERVFKVNRINKLLPNHKVGEFYI